MAVPHRYQRQDDDRADARVDAGRVRRPAPTAAGNVGLPLVDAVLRRGAVRRPRRRAVELPAALDALACVPWRRPSSTSPRTTSTGTARMDAYAADKGRVYANTRSPASTTSPIRGPRSSCARPTSRRAAGRSGSPSGVPSVGMLGVVEDVARRPGVHRRPRPRGRRAGHGRPTYVLRHRTTSPTPSLPPRSPGPTGSPRRRSAPDSGPSCRTRTGSPTWPTSTA